MIKTWLRLGGMAALAAAAFGLGRSTDAATIIYANNPAPGDSIVGPSTGFGSNSALIGTTGWRYRNVTRTGEIGIRTDIPDNDGGGGSVFFKSTNTAGTSGLGKADLYYTEGSTQATALGQLKDLTSLAYDWYRDVSSTTSGSQTVALKLNITNFAGKSGELVFEPYYTTGSVIPQSGNWVSEDIWGNKDTAQVWASGSSLPKPTGYQYLPLANFLDASNSYYLGDYWVTGITAGIGSGWAGTFVGAVDNIAFGFNGDDRIYNFEAVPEPGSIVMGLIAGGLGLAGAAWRRRRGS